MTQNTSIGIIGSGAMGAGIAHVAAMAGHKVVLYDNNTTALDKAKKSLAATLQKLQDKGKIASADEVQQRFSFADKTGSFADCGLIIEAIIEKLEVKKAVWVFIGAVWGEIL